MPRNTPCRDCKKRRRKCVWQENSSICTRCARLELNCAPFEDSGTDEDDLPAEDGTSELQYWLHNVSELENEMFAMEKYIQQQAIARTTPPPAQDIMSPTSTNSSTSTIRRRDELLFANSFLLHHQQKRQKRQQQQQGQEQQQPPQQEWNLTIVDGILRLETGITSIEELMNYMQASFRYLSPFNNFFQSESVRFESSSVNMLIRALRLVSQKIVSRPLIPLPINRLPVLHDYRAIIEQLIRTYFKYQNPLYPFLHAPTFMKHYHQLQDPMTCPITLALCVHTICVPRRIIGYTAVEKRQLAEFFYTKCKEMLVEMFDDPARKFETITVINLTQHFTTFLLLQFMEARRLSTMSYLLCLELYPIYKNKQMSQQMRIMFERHFIFAESFMRTLDMMIEDKVDDNLPTITSVEIGDDEDELTSQYLIMYNHILRLLTSPFMITLTAQIKRILNGLGGEISIEVIIRLTDYVKEWWSSIPDHLKLCEDPFRSDVKDLVEKCDSKIKLAMFLVVNAVPTVVNACLLKPRKTQENADVLMMVRERALKACLRACEIVLFTIKRRFAMDDDMPPMTFEMLVNVMYALSAIASNTDNTVLISSNLQSLFYDCFYQANAFFPSGHRIPPSLSPLKTLISASQIQELDIYERYPLPGYAFICDVFNQFFTHIQSQFHGSPTTNPMNSA
ncbi:hypothetical protein BDA99DRAFT_562422 [Phascolomyces articulosus]|uniref:Zn(2)-C6 fungal-type domain-containing protein n=1 Tax=Phascolomyces articulosus TaxID=60185 RepID=A0AAD5K4H7_9FUNG|nr:hypothetical protein BDA99DRAFT_562422 [Phascolomyces articulosus]